MRAATGAISAVAVSEGQIQCRVLGNVPPRGICGSGMVDAAAAGLDLGLLQRSGRLAGGKDSWMLSEPVALTQTDIRELQLAKGAISAGIRILLEQWGASTKDLTRLYLAGAFGNYINRASARRIGLINFPREKVHPAGNTALLGAKLALFSGDSAVSGAGGEKGEYADLRRKIQHVGLNENPQFQEVYVEEMSFPSGETT